MDVFYSETSKSKKQFLMNSVGKSSDTNLAITIP